MSLTSVNVAYAALGLLALVIVCALGEAFVRRILSALNRQRFQLDSALNNMSHGLCMFDATGVLRLMNANGRSAPT